MKYLILFILANFSSICFSNDYNGYWKGNLFLQGSTWPMRLHIIHINDSINVLLDIPNLVYAEEAIPTKLKNNTLELTLPFGLGTKEFKREKDKLLPLDNSQNLIFSKTKEPPYHIEKISWRSGQEILKGSIYIPKSKQKHSLLIRLHGSNIGSRNNWEYRSWADYFARKGIATVIYDRRGEGKSTCHSKDYSFESLSNDAVELVKEMKKRSDIDTDKIILNGGSQAAYISFMTHKKSNDIDFMILSSAPSVSLIEQERQSLIFRMRKNKESHQSINEAVGYQLLYFHYVMTGKNWDILEKAAIEAQNKPWAKYTDQPQKESDLKWYRDNFDTYNPALLIPQIKIPTLILFGEDDVITPPSIMIPHFENYIKMSNNDSFKIIICPNVGHSLEVALGRDRWGNIIFPQRSPVMFSEIEKWLEKFNLGGK